MPKPRILQEDREYTFRSDFEMIYEYPLAVTKCSKEILIICYEQLKAYWL
ncbi:MAG: hypothetical protein RMZ69_00425 [Nostoc sp. ChiQUE01a]|nr:hypothetical protein [Nostoc sp. ChiQUE01a]